MHFQTGKDRILAKRIWKLQVYRIMLFSRLNAHNMTAVLKDDQLDSCLVSDFQ